MPTEAFDHARLQPSVPFVSSPSFVAPSKNSTFVTVPSGSAAVAVIVMFAGNVNVAPFVGLAMLTVGDRFAALTTILTAAEVVVAVALSVAFAVRL